MLEDYTVIDLEMTGLNAKTDAIIETGAVRVRGGEITATCGALLFTGRRLPEKITELTGITPDMVKAGRDPKEAMEEFFDFMGEDILVGQNVIFDYSFLKQWAANHAFSFERTAVDTLKLARQFLPPEQKKDLANLCEYFGIARARAHRALDDAVETFCIMERLKARYGADHAEAFVPQPLRYQAKKQTPATGRQLEYLRRYAAHYGIKISELENEMTRSEASRLADRLIAQYGRLPAHFQDEK